MNIKTPGVYIKELRTQPVSVAGVSTAVPLFIGFTEIHHATPKTIANIAEFELHFGGGYAPKFDVTSVTNGVEMVADRRFFLYDTLHAYFRNGGGPCHICSAGDYSVSTVSGDFRDALQDTFAVIPTLDEVTLIFVPDLHAQYANNGVQDNLLLSTHYGDLTTDLFRICKDLQDKFCVFDYHNTDSTASDIRGLITPMEVERRYGAVYYPWLVSSDAYAVPFDDITGYSSTAAQPILDLDADLSLFSSKFSGTTLEDVKQAYNAEVTAFNAATHTGGQKTALKNMLKALLNAVDLLGAIETDAVANSAIATEVANVKANAAFIGEVQKIIRLINVLENQTTPSLNGTSSSGFITVMGGGNYPPADWFNYANANPQQNLGDVQGDISLINVSDVAGKLRSQVVSAIESGLYFDINGFFSFIVGIANNIQQRKDLLVQQLFQTDATYIDIQNVIQAYMKQIPSQGAVAGIYCRNDRDRGVWKSPANMGVQGIERPLVEVSNSEQDDLNVHTTGKSINVIRTFTGKGPVVWGARTWDGENPEWRYIAVRRFFNFAEESIKKALNHFLFEPNNARTWVKIQAMITGFLIDYWKAGALVGTKPEEAFFVRVDKNTTTDAEILQGIINIEVGMAVARPAEFIIIEFSHKTNA